MLRKARTFTSFCNESKEVNLLAAKRALKRYRGACLHRDITGDDDVIDIVVGAEIMERHVCRCPRLTQPAVSELETLAPQQKMVRRFRVEDLALYQ